MPKRGRALVKCVLGTNHLGADFGARLRRKFGPDQLELIEAMGDDSAHSCEAEHATAIEDADVFFGWPSGATFAAAKRLRWIACPGAGVDKIVKYESIKASSVLLTNSPGTHVIPMAEHVIGSMIALAHRFDEAEADRKSRLWDTQKWNNRIVELSGKVCGVYGYGRVGSAVADRARALGMSVVTSVREGSASAAAATKDGVGRLDSLDELCRQSRFLVVAAPATAATAGSIDRRRLQLLPRGAYVVVISRGGIVDEEALADLVEEGAVAGAAIDSTAVEPLPAASRLWTLPGVLLTPHSSALSAELFEMRRQVFEAQLARFIAGEALEHVIADKSAGY